MSSEPMTHYMPAVTRPTTMSAHASDLLLRHCFALGGTDRHRMPARARLEQAVGPELARKLVQSLTSASRR